MKPKKQIARPPQTAPVSSATNSLNDSQEKLMGGSSSRASALGLPSIRRVGSLSGSLNASPAANSSRPLSIVQGTVHLPQLASNVTSPLSGARSTFPTPAAVGAARRVSTKKSGKPPKNIVQSQPQPTERDVARIARWWNCVRMRRLVKMGAPSRSALHYMEAEAHAREVRVAKAKIILEKFLLRCASKLRHYVDQKRLTMLCGVSIVIGTFSRAKISMVLAQKKRVVRVSRCCERLIQYWRRSEQFKRREYHEANSMVRGQCQSEESLERREVERREKIAFLDIMHDHRSSKTGRWQTQYLARREIADGADEDDTWGRELVVASPMQSSASTQQWSSINRRARRQSFHSESGVAAVSTTQCDHRRKSLRKNSLMLQRMSRSGSVNLDGLLGGSKGVGQGRVGKGAPVSGAALRLRLAGDDGESSPKTSSQPTTAGLAFFGDNLDHLESVTSSPLLLEFSKRESTSTTRDRALADARLQLLNQQFLYPLRMSAGVVSLTSNMPVKQKLCVSEMFLGDGWATWFVSTSFVKPAAQHKKQPTSYVHRRSVVVRKRVGGELLDAHRRLSAVGSSQRRSVLGASTLSAHGLAEATAFSRFGARRSSLAQSRMGHTITQHDASTNEAHPDGTVNTRKGLALRANSTLFSVDLETERLLVQEHCQRMRVVAQAHRIFEDISQRIEEERQGELADLMGPSAERVHDRNVPQKEMFLYGIL